jgi:hypothetical protein
MILCRFIPTLYGARRTTRTVALQPTSLPAVCSPSEQRIERLGFDATCPGHSVEVDRMRSPTLAATPWACWTNSEGGSNA